LEFNIAFLTLILPWKMFHELKFDCGLGVFFFFLGFVLLGLVGMAAAAAAAEQQNSVMLGFNRV